MLLKVVLILSLLCVLVIGVMQAIGAYNLDEKDFADQRENLIICASASIIGSLILLALCYYVIKNNGSLNWLLFLTLVLFLGMGSYSISIALDLQCSKDDPKVLFAWKNSKNSALLGVLGSVLLLIIIFVKKNEILK